MYRCQMSTLGEQSSYTPMYQCQQQPDTFVRLEALIIKFITHSSKRQDEAENTLRNHQASISNIEKQVGQIAQLIQERIPENLPEFKLTNPNAQCNAIITRSGKVLPEPIIPKEKSSEAIPDKLEQRNEEERDLTKIRAATSNDRSATVLNPSKDFILVDDSAATNEDRAATNAKSSDKSSTELDRAATTPNRAATNDQNLKNSKNVPVIPPYRPPIPYPERLKETNHQKDFKHLSSVYYSKPTLEDGDEAIPFGMDKLIKHSKSSDESVLFLDEFDFILQEEMKAMEEERMGNEALLLEDDFDAQRDIEVLEKLMGQEVKEEEEKLDEEPNIVTPDLTKEDQTENTLISKQKEEIFGIEKDTSDESVIYIDEFDETLEEEWRNSQVRKGGEEMEESMVKEKPREDTPKKIPPKPPEYPFVPKPHSKHSKRIKTQNVTNMDCEQVKQGAVRSKKRKSQAKECYEHKRDKWKEKDNDDGERGKRKKGVKASPDATVPT